jgi:hypothetical protein
MTFYFTQTCAEPGCAHRDHRAFPTKTLRDNYVGMKRRWRCWAHLPVRAGHCACGRKSAPEMRHK